MRQSTLPVRTTSTYTRLAEFEERTVSLREAIWHVKQSRYVAFSSPINSDGNFAMVDVSKALALRTLRGLKGRVKRVNIAEIFGTLTFGV